MKLPTILLLNGLFQFQPAVVTPLGPLASDLRAQGFRVITDNHLQLWHSDEEPVIVIGHSRGGAQALQFQKQQQQKARFVPLAITFDAAPPFQCPVKGKCINIGSDYYFGVPGAENVQASRLAGFPVIHSFIPLTTAVRSYVVRRVMPYAKPMN